MQGKPIPVTADGSGPAGAIPIDLYGAGGEIDGLMIRSTNTVVGEGAGSSLTPGPYRTFLGNNAGSSTTYGEKQVLIGSLSSTNPAALEVVAVGHDSRAIHYAVGVGNAAKAEGTHSVAVGSSSRTGAESVAVGGSATARGEKSVAIGYNAEASIYSTRTIAIGRGASVEGNDSIAIGDESTAGQTQNSVAIGARTATTHDNQVAFGERDVEVQSSEFGLVLKSPNGTRYRILVDDSGDISATPLT